MIHIVFQEADIAALSKSFELDPTLQGEVISFRDDYALGPLTGIYTNEGLEARSQWWKEVLATADVEEKGYYAGAGDNTLLQDLMERLSSNGEETLWIWAAQNAHDVSGYYWLVSQLQSFAGRVFILYLNNLPFINDKGHIFYPTKLFDIPAREFVKAKKLARPVTNGEFEVDAGEWTKLVNEGKQVRILEGGKKLVQYNDDYYDNELLKGVTADWQKVNRFLHAYFTRVKSAASDAYILWRLKLMIEKGTLDAQGELKNIKDFEIKLKAPLAVVYE